MPEENNQLLNFLKNLPIPDLIKQNVITALSKGLGKLIGSAIDIPVAHLENNAKVVRAEGDAKVTLIKAAAKSAAELFKTNSDLADRALQNYGKRIIEGQVNKDKIADRTINYLQNTQIISDTSEKIDDDWLTLV